MTNKEYLKVCSECGSSDVYKVVKSSVNNTESEPVISYSCDDCTSDDIEIQYEDEFLAKFKYKPGYRFLYDNEVYVVFKPRLFYNNKYDDYWAYVEGSLDKDPETMSSDEIHNEMDVLSEYQMENPA